MRRQLLCTTAAIAITAVIGSVSLAADMPVKAAPPPLMNWAGFYAGLNIDIGQGRFISNPNSGTGSGDVTNKPVILHGGFHVGQNWQANAFVYGWEFDVTGGGLSHRQNMVTAGRSIRDSINLLTSFRGRWGLAFDRTLLYATAGVAYTYGRYLSRSPGGTQHGCCSLSRFGGVAGLGAEWKQTQTTSWRLEGLYYFFGNQAYHFGTDHVWDHRLKDAWVVRLGATHHY